MTSTWVIHPAESAPEEIQKHDADSKSHPLSGSASGPERKRLTPVYQQCQGGARSSLVQVVLQLVARAVGTQFVQRPGFNLPNAFPRHLECFADF